jgi:hypothetical protein
MQLEYVLQKIHHSHMKNQNWEFGHVRCPWKALTKYSLHLKLFDTFNKSLCPKLDDLFLRYPNLDIF